MNVQKVFSVVVEEWKAYKRHYVKKSSFAAYVLLIENHLLPCFGDCVLVHESVVQSFVLKKLDAGLSHKTVKDILIVLRMILKFGSRKGIFVYQPFEVQFPTQRVRASVEVLSRLDQRKIMEHIRQHFTFRNLGVYICLSAGMRIGEICALKWEDVDMDKGIISVRRTIQRVYIIEDGRRRTELVMDTPKTSHSVREIPMVRDLWRMVKPLKKLVNETFFVLTNDLRPTEPRTYRSYYKSLMRELAMPELKFHGLRHSFATRCIESKCDYKTVSVLLGHSNITTTLNLYVHPNMEQKKRAVEQMFKGLK